LEIAMYVETPPTFDETWDELEPNRLMELLGERGSINEGSEYLHWDKLRHLEQPAGLTHREWWFLLKLGRRSLLRPLPLRDPEGMSFVYSTPDMVLRELHFVDQRCSGEIKMAEVVTADAQARQHYLVNSLMEEAIRSSQLEGATTSRRAAKALLRSGREPKDRSERMILNNYRAIQFMREMGDTLTPEIVLELQRILTDGTLDTPDAAGRLQRPDEVRVAVYDRQDDTLIHQPPPAEQLPDRLRAMCDFANEADDDPEAFMHPVVRAILLHFWLAYDHPFEDGNGRTARALFYWLMRNRGYWLTEYLSVSNILREAPSQYTKAFMKTENDEGDTTYFIEYQLDVIHRAIEDLHTYLERKARDIRDVEKLIKGSPEFNHRQLSLLSHAIRKPDAVYTFSSHAQSHGVTHETARNDLLPLEKKRLLESRKDGRRYVFTPSPRLPELLKKSGRKSRSRNGKARRS
jgi:Fic family protein